LSILVAHVGRPKLSSAMRVSAAIAFRYSFCPASAFENSLGAHLLERVVSQLISVTQRLII